MTEEGRVLIAIGFTIARILVSIFIMVAVVQKLASGQSELGWSDLLLFGATLVLVAWGIYEHRHGPMTWGNPNND